MKFQIEVLKSKIHRVSVTQADLNYVAASINSSSMVMLPT